jgi:hypothetical protein
LLGVLVLLALAVAFFLATGEYLRSTHISGPWAGALRLTGVAACGPACLGMHAQRQRAAADTSPMP